MGLAYAAVTLSNPSNSSLRGIQVRALADTGAITLCTPEHVSLQLGLETLEQREVTSADGRRHTVPDVGPIEVRFDNRGCFGGALVLGDEVLLGAVQMEDMDLIVVPRKNLVAVNPESPNIPLAKVK